jgi:hypothetical protein
VSKELRKGKGRVGAPGSTTTMPDQKSTTMSELLSECAAELFVKPLAHVRRFKGNPHCDCEESNRAAGLVKAKMNQRRNDADDAWSMVPVELNKKGACAHCNYEPFYQEYSVGEVKHDFINAPVNLSRQD